MRSGKPIWVPPRLSGVSPMLPWKQFQCWSDWRWPFLVLSWKIVERFLSLRLSVSKYLQKLRLLSIDDCFCYLLLYRNYDCGQCVTLLVIISFTGITTVSVWLLLLSSPLQELRLSVCDSCCYHPPYRSYDCQCVTLVVIIPLTGITTVSVWLFLLSSPLQELRLSVCDSSCYHLPYRNYDCQCVTLLVIISFIGIKTISVWLFLFPSPLQELRLSVCYSSCYHLHYRN